MKKRLGEVLLERGLIDIEQLHEALAHQREWGTRLGAALVAKGFIAEGTLTHVLSEVLGFPMVDLARVVIDPLALAVVSRRTCEDENVLPLAVKAQANGRRVLLLAMADPLNATVIDEIGFTTDCIVKPAIAQFSSIEQAIRRYHHGVQIEIAPLDFVARRAQQTLAPVLEPMTITTVAGGELRVGVDPRNADERGVLTLTEEVSGRTTSAPPLPDEYSGQRTGVFSMPPVSGLPRTMTPVVTGRAVSDEGLALVQATELERLESMERKFWALLRVLARRGVIAKEEFVDELRGSGEF
jgi:hypothetical protein